MEGCALDVLPTLDAGSVQTCVTSPPYWGLRDYGRAGQIGLEDTPEAYVDRLVSVFREVRRVLADDGVLWLNLGDTLRGKQLLGIPWRVAFALQADGWYLRSDIIWHKRNGICESVNDRPTRAHEHVFMMSTRPHYFSDFKSVRQETSDARAGRSGRLLGGIGASVGNRVDTPGRDPGSNLQGGARGIEPIRSPDRNLRDVWPISTSSRWKPDIHQAVMPPDLVEPCIKAGSRIGDTVLDPFSGAGTVGMVARRLQRQYVGVELNSDYAALSRERIEGDQPLFNRAGAT